MHDSLLLLYSTMLVKTPVVKCWGNMTVAAAEPDAFALSPQPGLSLTYCQLLVIIQLKLYPVQFTV